jgi:hypothetical protein
MDLSRDVKCTGLAKKAILIKGRRFDILYDIKLVKTWQASVKF